MQCGTCTASCVVQEFHPDFNVRRMMTRAAMGEEKEIAESDDIWLCAHCHMCIARCPKDVKPGEKLAELRTMALKRGVSNQGVRHAKAFVDSMLKNGVINEAKIIIDSIGLQGMMAQSDVALKMAVKGKSPKFFKSPIKGMDKLKPLLKEVECEKL